VKLGVITPVVTLLPRAHAPWEADAGIDEVALVAEAADRLGYHHLTCSEHVVVPTDVAEVRGSRYWDPLATLGFLAARTEQIRLATHVVVLGYHHPLAIAKRYGTLDQVSGGRLILGVGVGSLAEEFDLLGAPFDDRGPRADDALRALRTSLSTERPTYDGPHYRFDDVVLDPHARQARVPIWIGGRTRRSLRRAVELADGWVPFGLGPDELAALFDEIDTPPDFERVLWPDRAVDPLGDPDGTRVTVDRYRALGTTVLNLRFRSDSPAHYIEQLAAMADQVD
jgi:probable F420-dependent oxidoreductase